MVSINFYHLTTTPLERTLPKLLEKCYSSGVRSVVLADEARVEKLNELLWNYDPDSFLPHGSLRDGNADRQPIFFSCDATALSEGEEGRILVITNGHYVEETKSYSRIIDIFDGSSDEMLAAARRRWQQYKNSGQELNYYQQTDNGNWEKKNA